MPEYILDGKGSIEFQELPPMVRGYVECAFFTAPDDDESGNVNEMSFHELAPDTLKTMIADCEKFQADNAANIAKLDGATWDGSEKWGAYDLESVGRDLWFTRNGHGVGFWDRGFIADDARQAADDLTSACEALGECDIYKGDDGKIYI